MRFTLVQECSSASSRHLESSGPAAAVFDRHLCLAVEMQPSNFLYSRTSVTHFPKCHGFRLILCQKIVTGATPPRNGPVRRRQWPSYHRASEHRVCETRGVFMLITRELEHGALVAIVFVKTILAVVHTTGDVRTLLVDADPHLCRCWGLLFCPLLRLLFISPLLGNVFVSCLHRACPRCRPLY